MKTHHIWPAAFLLLALAGSAPAFAETRVGGTLTGENTWTKEGSPYVATKDIIIAKNGTLRIGPGVDIKFKADIASQEGSNPFDLELLVQGTLIIEGAEGDTVHLVSDSDRPRWTDWQGIVIQGGGRAELRAVAVAHANEGIKVMPGASLKAVDITVRQCHQYGIVFNQSSGDLAGVYISSVGNSGGTSIGINADRGTELNLRDSFIIGVQNGLAFSRNSKGTVERTVVSSCASRGIIIRNSDPALQGCTVTSNDYGLVISAGAAPKIRDNNIFQNVTADVQITEYRQRTRIDLANNWWGETALGLIEERILDGLDDPENHGFVNIEPILTEAYTPPEDGGR